MAYTFIQINTAGAVGTGKVRAFTSDVTAGSLLTCHVRNSDGSNAVTGVSDDVNGAWTQAETKGPDADNNTGELWYFFPAAAGTTTVTVAGSMTDASIRNCPTEFGATASTVLVDSNSQDNGAAGTTLDSGLASNTGTIGDALVVGGGVTGAQVTYTEGGTGSTFVEAQDTPGRVYVQYDLTAAAGNSESIATWSGATESIGIIAIFGVLAGGPVAIPSYHHNTQINRRAR